MAPNEVIKGLFVGDEYDALNSSFLETFACIINVTRESPFSKLLPQSIETLRLPIYDLGDSSEQQLMLQHFEVGTSLIHRHLSGDRTVLVHCMMGMQRSCALVAAYLIKYCKLSKAVALALILSCRPLAFDNGTHVHFNDALSAWDKLVKKSRINDQI